MNIRAKGSVSIPSPPKSIGGVLAYCRAINRSVQQLRDRTWTVNAQSRPGGVGDSPPLWPKLKKDGDAFTVSLSPGFVNERIPGDSDALAVQEIENLKWGGDAPSGKTADDLREFPIVVGKQISVIVYVSETGELGGDDAPADTIARIQIEDEDAESTHYVPPCGDDADGASGAYHYKIAVLRAADATHSGPWLELYLAGSHISHFRDLPQIDNYSDGTDDTLGRVVGEFDNADAKYKFRGIRGKFGLKSGEEAQLINIDIDALNIGGGSGVWKNPNGEEPEDGDTFGDEPFKLRTLRGMTTDEADTEGITPQIVVSIEDGEDSDAGAKDTLRIRGNAKKGKRFVGTPNEIEWKDGLVTSEGNGDESGALDVILWSCDGEEPSSDPTTWTRRILLRMSFANGILVGVNETFIARALAETREFSFIQDCCFVGDDPMDSR